MSAPVLSRMDFKKNQLVGLSGKTYFIQPEMSADRHSVFVAFQPLITKGATYKEWADNNTEIYRLATNGSDIMGSLHRIATLTMNMNSVYKEFTSKQYHAIMWMAMIFINGEGEDIGLWDERVAEMKIQDLKHYDFRDFFFVCQKALPEWSRRFRSEMGIDPVDVVPEKSAEEILSQGIVTS